MSEFAMLSEVKLSLSDHVTNAFYIDGKWIRPEGTQRFTLVSPATDVAWLSVPLASNAEIDLAIAAARRAFDEGPWPRMSGEERGVILRALASEIRNRLPLLAKLWTAQVGAPYAFTQRLVKAGQDRFDFFAHQAETYRFEVERKTLNGTARVRREPIGVAALIAPWNATFPIVSHKIAAALAAGCTMIVKSPVECPLDALIIAECAHAVGLPPGVLNVLTADQQGSARLVQSTGVDKISFTGSIDIGVSIANVAAQRMARTTLELGGKSAAILLEDVDLPQALASLCPFTMPFSGQICFAQTRILVPQTRAQEMIDAFAARVSNFKVGDPWREDTQMGPLLNQRQYDRVTGFIRQGVEGGATLLTGGSRAEGFSAGHFLAPTVFSNVQPGMAIAQQEIFGPVVSILTYRTEQEAVQIANGTAYGLSGSVFCSDVERAYSVACQLRTGHVGVNGMELSPVAPFGGYKMSGIGREGGREGLEAFLECKSIMMPFDPSQRSPF